MKTSPLFRSCTLESPEKQAKPAVGAPVEVDVVGEAVVSEAGVGDAVVSEAVVDDAGVGEDVEELVGGSACTTSTITRASL
jgi:hypothetical protein